MLDMSPRVKRARTIALVAAGAGLLGAAPWLGWWVLVLFGLAVGDLATLERRIAASRRPERVIAGTILRLGVMLIVAAALSGGARSAAFAWVIIPVGVSAARFRAGVVYVGALLAGAGMVAVAFAVDAHGVINDPRPLLGAIVLLVAIIALTTALTGAELQYRSESILDPLTGLLNRTSLAARFEEVSEQARLVGSPVSIVVADLDHFKQINDSFGHERGDAVLRDVSYAMRKALRSFELLYRVGGEEFVLLLPGADREAANEMAERLRTAVAADRPGGLDVTISVGVATASPDAADYETLFAAGDEALYVAKEAGRNRVVASHA